MDMDMNMDVAWCLTCSKRTRDPRNPYCSEGCRAQDLALSAPSSQSGHITSPVPLFMSTSPTTETPRATSPAKRLSIPLRPPMAPIHPPCASGSIAIVDMDLNNMPPRDRRAFSFPAAQSPTPPPIPISQKRQARESQNALPPFARKPLGVSLNAMASPNLPAVADVQSDNRSSVPTTRVSKSTREANTPLDPESVFCSTSESEEEHDSQHPSPLKLMPTLPTPTTSTVPSSLSLSRKSTSKSHRSSLLVKSSKPNRHTLSSTHREYYARNGSQSPVAALIASSASSRSREDIISWAKAVGLRPGSSGDTSEEDEQEEARGRSRTRRMSANTNMTSPRGEQSTLHDHPENEAEHALGTTPKGRIGSALAGLGIGGFGVGPIVKALTSTIAPQPATSSSAGLQSVPARPEVSRVAVVSMSGGMVISGKSGSNPSDSDAPPPTHFGGATPTLSTISISEVVDPFIIDNHIEVITDDAFSTSSYAHGPPSLPKAFKSPGNRPMPLPLRPITSTATAIWNLSTYIRSFAPFSIGSTNAKLGESSKVVIGTASPVKVITTTTDSPAKAPLPMTGPMPTSRSPSDETDEPPSQQMVRSLPMDIVMPLNSANIAANEERAREREVREWLDRSKSRQVPGSSSRSRRRSGSRKVKARPLVCSVSHSVATPPSQATSQVEESRQSHMVPQPQVLAQPPKMAKKHSYKVSYDADASADEDGSSNDEPRRGRSRRGKVLAREIPSHSRKDSDEGDLARQVGITEIVRGSVSEGRRRKRSE